MAFETRDMSGSLFKNDKKEQPTHADYQGKCMVDGTEYYMNTWIKEGKSGKFMSMSFKPVQAKEDQKPRTHTGDNPFNDGGDSIPF